MTPFESLDRREPFFTLVSWARRYLDGILEGAEHSRQLYLLACTRCQSMSGRNVSVDVMVKRNKRKRTRWSPVYLKGIPGLPASTEAHQ